MLIFPVLVSAQGSRSALYESIYNSSKEYEGDITSLLAILNGVYKNLNGEGYPMEYLNGNMYYSLGNTSQGLSLTETANSLANTLQISPEYLKEMCSWCVSDYIAENGWDSEKEKAYKENIKEFFGNSHKKVDDILQTSNMKIFNLYIPEDGELVTAALIRSFDQQQKDLHKHDPQIVYKDSVSSLADNLKEKLEKIQRKSGKGDLWLAAEYALEDLKNTRNFYLDAPSEINLDWDLGERPFKKYNGSRYPDYQSKSYLSMLINDNDILFWPSNAQNYKDSENSSNQITFYDPSGRKITVPTSLPSMEQWEQFRKETSKVVGYQEAASGIVTYKDINNGRITPSLIKRAVPTCWRAESKITDNIVILPFGKLLSSSFANQNLSEGYEVSCRDIESLSIHLEKVNIPQEEEAIAVGIISTNYGELLEWYKKSLHHLMRRVDALSVKELKRENEEKQRSDSLTSVTETARETALPQFLKTAAERIRNEKNMFDYVISKEDERDIIYIQVLTNSNSLRLYNDFWKMLESVVVENGNLSLCPTLYIQEGLGSPKRESIDLEISYPIEDQNYLYDLFNDIKKSLIDNINQFITETFTHSEPIYDVQSPVCSRLNQIGIGTEDKMKYVDLPILISSYQPAKGSVICVKNYPFYNRILKEDYDKKGYKVKVK